MSNQLLAALQIGYRTYNLITLYILILYSLKFLLSNLIQDLQLLKIPIAITRLLVSIPLIISSFILYYLVQKLIILLLLYSKVIRLLRSNYFNSTFALLEIILILLIEYTTLLVSYIVILYTSIYLLNSRKLLRNFTLLKALYSLLGTRLLTRNNIGNLIRTLASYLRIVSLQAILRLLRLLYRLGLVKPSNFAFITFSNQVLF